ncbi:MAG TPA: hypothetical protein VEU96_05770 [Bryobacteraceae bacterium]|nr:hypothetical protein [Bryobacteraceae bacterium]
MRHNSTGLRFRPLAVLGLLASLCATAVVVSAAELAIRPSSHRRLNVKPAELGGVVYYGPNRTTYFLHSQGVVHRIGDDDESLVRIPLQSAPEGVNSQVLYSDIAVDSKGQMFVAATWTRRPNGGGAGILVYDSDGRYQRSIVLSPRSNIRHLAIDPSGNIFVLGIDPGYFRGAGNSCFLIHKYTPDGSRVNAFSACPIPPGDRTLEGGAWDLLTFEVDRGSLWLENGKLYHVLPANHVIRVFDPVTGVGIGEIPLQPPQPEALGTVAAGPSAAWRVLSRGRDGFLVVWSTPTGAGRASVVTAHDRNGAATAGQRTPSRIGMPVASAFNGHVFLLTPQPDGTVSLLRGAVVRTE